MTRGIWQILTQTSKSLKNVHFNEPFLIKVYSVWAKKSTKELCLMALKNDEKFDEKLTCAFNNDMKKLEIFHKIAISF